MQQKFHHKDFLSFFSALHQSEAWSLTAILVTKQTMKGAVLHKYIILRLKSAHCNLPVHLELVEFTTAV